MFSRIRRKLFAVCSIISLLLCMAAGVLWVRSAPYRPEVIQIRYNRWTAPREARRLFFSGSSYAGTLTFRLGYQSFTATHFKTQGAEVLGIVQQQSPAGCTGRYLGPSDFIFAMPPEIGFRAQHYSNLRLLGHRDDDWWLAAPHWFVMLVLLILPAWWMVRFWRTRRIKQIGLCPACGYDLRASPERCPECGLVRGEQVAP